MSFGHCASYDKTKCAEMALAAAQFGYLERAPFTTLIIIFNYTFLLLHKQACSLWGGY